MALAVGFQGKFTLDNAGGSPVDISAYITAVNGWDASTDMADTTTLGSGSKTMTPTLKDGDVVTVECIWDTVIHAQVVAMRAAQSATTTFTAKYSPAGTTTGLPYEQAEFYVTKWSAPIAVGDVNKATLTLQMTGACSFGTN